MGEARIQARVALVTGAARGIGRQVALTLAEKGYMVAVNDLDTPERVLQELEQAGARTLSVPGDVSDEESVRGMVEAVGAHEDVKVSAGDVVVLRKYAGTEFKLDGEEHLIVDGEDNLGWSKIRQRHTDLTDTLIG